MRRTQLDAGQNLNKITMTYKPEGGAKDLLAAIGLKKAKSEHGKDFNKEHGWLTKFEDVEKNAGKQGLAIIVDDPSLIQQETADEKQLILVTKTPNNVITYRTGFFWDKANQFDGYDAWKKYVNEQAQGIASPIEVTVGQ